MSGLGTPGTCSTANNEQSSVTRIFLTKTSAKQHQHHFPARKKKQEQKNKVQKSQLVLLVYQNHSRSELKYFTGEYEKVLVRQRWWAMTLDLCGTACFMNIVSLSTEFYILLSPWYDASTSDVDLNKWSTSYKMYSFHLFIFFGFLFVREVKNVNFIQLIFFKTFFSLSHTHRLMKSVLFVSLS